MENGKFMDLVSVHYKDIKNLFKSRLKNINRSFDEDIFNDAFIKCAQRFGNEVIDYDITVKYFWIAYLNAIKSAAHNNRLVEMDETLHDCIEEDEPSYSDQIYNMVMDAIEAAYGENDMMMYSLYKYHGWSEEELVKAGYDCIHLKTRVKNIHKFVKAYCKKYIINRK